MIDWETFEILIDEPSEENREMLSEFIADARMRIGSLASGAITDLNVGAAELHQLKGTSANFGFEAFREAARAAELTAKAGSPVDFLAVALRLEELLLASVEEVRQRNPGLL